MKVLQNNPTKYKIPFDSKGNQLSYYDGDWGYSLDGGSVKAILKSNFVFEDTLEIIDFSRGQSSAVFNIISKTDGKHYSMMMSEIIHVIRNHKIDCGVFSGKFTFKKKGMNYSLAQFTKKASEVKSRLDSIDEE